jgi:predicted small secreted protein
MYILFNPNVRKDVKMKTKRFVMAVLIGILAMAAAVDVFAQTNVLEGKWVCEKKSRTLEVTGNNYVVYTTGKPNDIKSKGTLTFDARNPVKIGFKGGAPTRKSPANWEQPCTLSGNTLTINKRSDNGTPRVATGAYVKQGR